MLVYTTITFPIVQMNYTKLCMLYVFVLPFEAWNDMKPMHQLFQIMYLVKIQNALQKVILFMDLHAFKNHN